MSTSSVALGGRMTKHVIDIREERPADVEAIRRVNRQAFDREQEGRIIDALRDRGAVLLSLVALVNDDVVGHLLFSPAIVGSTRGAALGPLAVVPAHQRQGIGSQLVANGLERLQALGCPFAVVIGHPEYYPRFGFESAAASGLTCDWDVPPGAFMVKVLSPAAKGHVRGHVAYQAEFAGVE